MKTLPLIICLILLIQGCSKFNETRLEGALGKDVDLIDYSYDIADDLLESAYPPLVPMQPELAILTTTFVDNNNLTLTSHFGRILQDNIASRFVQQGYTVKEVKLRKDMQIEEKSGETILSRDLNLIKPNQNAQAVLAGTISHAQRTMYISARLIDPRNGTILSSRNYRLYMDRNVMAMLNLKTVGNTEMIEEPKEPLMNSVLY